MRFPSWIITIGLTLAVVGCHSSSQKIVELPGRDTTRARDLNDRAFKLISSGKFADAEPLVRDAVQADPMYGPARNNLGLVYYQSGRLYEAAWEFENAIRLMPYQPEARNNLGLVLEKAGKLSGAADNFAKARDMEPDNPEYLGNLARLHVRRGDHDDETQKLLEEVAYKDARPQWNDWAKMSLFRMKSMQPDRVDEPSATLSPTTQP